MTEIMEARMEELNSYKTEALNNLLDMIKEQKKALKAGDLEKFNSLFAETKVLMGRVDTINESLKQVVKVEPGNEDLLLNEEQKSILLAIQQFHQEVLESLLQQKKQIGGAIKGLKDKNNKLDSYRAGSVSLEGAFIDKRK